MTIRRTVRMNPSALLWLGIAALILQGAKCEAQTDQQLLAKSVLSYHYHTAPLAPVFLSEYVVTVEPSRSVSLWYRFGPGSPVEGTTRKFQLSSQLYRKLIDTLAGAGVLANGWAAGATPIGASQESVTIEEPSGKTVTISSVLTQEPMTRFLVVADAMRAAVPKVAWIAKDRDQRAYQTSIH
jgi:hypothetical protein